MKDQLYFIAIVPPDDLSDQITRLKHEFADRFGSKHALRSPPHITLHMPFKWKDEKRGKLIATLEATARSLAPFSVDLDGFDTFAPRVIYVDVKASEALDDCQRGVVKAMRSLHILNAAYKDRPFHPHVTVAFRDLKKSVFPAAWEAYKDRSFSAWFRVASIVLLRHINEPSQKPHWEVDWVFPF